MLIAPFQQHESAVESAGLLIIEDDLRVRALLDQLFRDEYRLTFVETDDALLSTLKAQTVDLILLDVTMPEVDGLELLREIRGEMSSTELPVILISWLDDNRPAVRGLQLGANDYITKPLDAEVVRARVNTQIALKRAEIRRKQTITQLEFAQEMQENFTRIVSHDLKGPLTNIRMAQFMLRDILHDNPEGRSILDNMDVTLNSMIEMIRVFLDAMDAQQLEPALEALHVHDLVVEIIEQYRLAADRKQIRLFMHDCERQVTADARLLRQVFANLLSNAIKFSPQGKQITVWTEVHDDWVRICVADQGPGILREEQEKLFQMFSKLSARPTGGETSTGLGLWIVRELTRLQGGQVGIDQPAEGGSVFWIELPGA